MSNKMVSIFSIILFNIMTSCAKDKKDYIVTIKTDLGTMIAILYDETPKHKENFIKLAQEHYYDSMIFHRVIRDFMIQGGDPDSKHAKANQSLGTGGPGYTVEAEIHNHLFHEKGALSAARLGDMQNPAKASSGSQFYIVQGTVIPEKDTLQMKVDQAQIGMGMQQFLQNEKNKSIGDSLNQLYTSGDMDAYMNQLIALVPQIEKETGVKINRDVSKEKIKAYTTIGGTPHLDNEYTVFGKVIKGLEVIDKIAQVNTGAGDRPVEDIHFYISVEELPRKKISKLYGYVYPDEKGKP